jgi:hypothetical protein
LIHALEFNKNAHTSRGGSFCFLRGNMGIGKLNFLGHFLDLLIQSVNQQVLLALFDFRFLR